MSLYLPVLYILEPLPLKYFGSHLSNALEKHAFLFC